MRYALIIISLVWTSVSAANQVHPTWDMGFGMESRMRSEVNPEYRNLQSQGQLFAELRLVPWAAVLEVGREAHRTNSGSFSVTNEVTDLGLWSRYEFLVEPRWTPFAALGVGSYFDRIETRFEGAQDTRTAQRYWGGAGGGVRGVFWQMLLLEGELRLTAVQEQKDPMFSGLLKVGVQI